MYLLYLMCYRVEYLFDEFLRGYVLPDEVEVVAVDVHLDIIMGYK